MTLFTIQDFFRSRLFFKVEAMIIPVALKSRIDV